MYLTDEEMDEQGTGNCRTCLAPNPMPVFDASGEDQIGEHCYDCGTFRPIEGER